MDYKKIKKDAKANLKKNYLKKVIIVFICTILIAGGINFSSKNILNVDLSKKENIEIIYNSQDKSHSEIIDELLEKTVEERKQQKENEHKYTKGVLAIVINEVTATKSVLFSILDSINNIFGGKISIAVIIILANLVFFVIKTFFIEVLNIGKIRFFLEQRRYTNTNLDRILYPYKKKRNFQLSIILFLKNFYLALWSLTIIGRFIKHYEYLMVPYVLAENPNIKAKDAFKLSKELTEGEKFKLFKLDLSILLWEILGLFTFNLLNIFYTNIYKEALFSEVYANLRSEKKDKISLGEELNDEYLFLHEVIDEAYPEESISSKILNIDINKEYSLTSYILFFFSFCFVGYLYEVVIFLIKNGEFVNRGMMYGPWLPIYGIGLSIILYVLKKFNIKSWLGVFCIGTAIAAATELIGSYIGELITGKTLWDYTGYFGNFEGRIAVKPEVYFGILILLAYYSVYPWAKRMQGKYKRSIMRNYVSWMIIMLFFADVIAMLFIGSNI